MHLYLEIHPHARSKPLYPSQDLLHLGSNLGELLKIFSTEYLLLRCHPRELTNFSSSGLNSTLEKFLQLMSNTKKAHLPQQDTRLKCMILMVCFLKMPLTTLSVKRLTRDLPAAVILDSFTTLMDRLECLLNVLVCFTN